MAYTVRQLARLSGVSPRTLRYYDDIGLLPVDKNESGYRMYGPAEVERLQQILFYRELGMPLERIGAILSEDSFDGLSALKEHRERLLARRIQLDALIANVEKTIVMTEGEGEMSDRERFEGFKQRMIEVNEERYGREVREKYGDGTVERANERVKGMNEADYAEAERLSKEISETLGAAFREGDPAGALAQRACELHRQWLMHFWDKDAYSLQAHMALAQMYVDDPRFAAHYDAIAPGCTVFLRDAMRVYTGIDA